jgi:cardiolipin synthase A/B
MIEICASIFPYSMSEDTHWIILLAQSVAFVAAVAIVLRLAHEKRTPSNIFAWSLFLIFTPLIGVPFYLMLGGRKIRRIIDEKNRIQRLAYVPTVGDIPSARPGRAIPGNSVRVLKDGVNAYRVLCKEIDRAKESIDIITFILGNDAVGKSIVNRLTEKAKQGVRVRLLIDALGSMNARDKMFTDFLVAGGEVARFIPFSMFFFKGTANLRNHRKIAIFDSRRAIVGGQNMDRRFLSPTYSKVLFADLGLIVSGPAVGKLMQVFAGDWAYASKRDLLEVMPKHIAEIPSYGHSDLEIIPSGPDVDGDPLWERIITLVQDARENVTIVTPYFIPDEVLLRTLLIKEHNGVHVRIVVPEISNHPIVDMARNRYLRQMNSQGVEILFYKRRMLHAKLILFDGKFAVTGSANIDPRSFFVNFEIGLVHNSPEDIAGLEQWLEMTILPYCSNYNESRFAKPRRLRLLGENLAHLMTPML